MHPKRLDPSLNTGSTFSDLWLPFDLDCNRQSEIYVGLDSLLIIQTKDGKTRNLCKHVGANFWGRFRFWPPIQAIYTDFRRVYANFRRFILS